LTWYVCAKRATKACFCLIRRENPCKRVFFPVVCAPHVHGRGFARARAVSNFLSPQKTRQVSGMSCTCTTIFGNKCRKTLFLSVHVLNLTRYVRETLTCDKNPITYMVFPTRIMFVRYVSCLFDTSHDKPIHTSVFFPRCVYHT
jgi:hypothetical protein